MVHIMAEVEAEVYLVEDETNQEDLVAAERVARLSVNMVKKVLPTLVAVAEAEAKEFRIAQVVLVVLAAVQV